MLHARRLYHFLAIANAGSITGAAEQLSVTQPALTRSLKQLEELLEVELVERTPSGIILTPAGKILARRAKLMNLEYQHAMAEVTEWTQGVRGHLNIAAGPAWILQILPSVMAEYYRQYPDIRVSLSAGGFDSQLERLLTGEVDAVCGALDFPAHAELVKEPLTRLRHTFVGRREHPLVSKEIIEPEDLAQYSWVILSDDHISSGRIGAYFVANGLEPPHVVMETNAMGALAVVRRTDHLTTFASVARPTLEALGLSIIDHKGTLWDFEAGITYLKSSTPTPALNGFRSVLRSQIVDS